MTNLLKTFTLLSLLLIGAIFGFFYAWICSTMWGLDNLDPKIAIAAMQGMNASVRNTIFAPIFFGPAPILMFTAIIAFLCQRKTAGFLLLSAGALYLIGGNVLTYSVNVQMNEALALVEIPQSTDAAAAIWADYSPKWQFWNITRTIFSGISLCLTGLALMDIGLKKVG